MLTLNSLLLKTQRNLLTLEERRAKQGGLPDLRLLNEIEDHQTALVLIKAAIAEKTTEAGLVSLKESLRPLLVAVNVERINVETLKLEKAWQWYEPEMIFVPAGPFLMGCGEGGGEESPRHEVELSRYRISKYPVTNRQYAEFIKQNRAQPVPKKAGWRVRQPSPDKLSHPVVGVSWHDAQAYCGWLQEQTGRPYRLPTEAEWEKAASWCTEQSGGQQRLYPWGNVFDKNMCNSAEAGVGGTTPVGHYSPQGDSACGCADMAGNVREWTSTLWGGNVKQSDYPYPYRADDGRENLVMGSYVFRIYRGGSFRDPSTRLKCFIRGWSDPDTRIKYRGFRVAAGD